MNIEIWTRRHFTKDSAIEWPCPYCKNSSLKILENHFWNGETAESKKMRYEEEFWEVEWINLVFSGVLTCTNCSEHITFTGRGNPEPQGFYDYELDQMHHQYVEEFVPTFFEPELNIFDIPKECPEAVTVEIKNSFRLFWSDLPSAANRIRTSLEILLNEHKVKRFVVNNNKRNPISLHKRILLFNNKELTDLLLAIKWIGNAGSHIANMETIDILETYKLLEFALNKLYNNEDKDIKKIAKGINKKKGMRKRN